MHEYLNSILGPYLLGMLVSAGIGLILGLEREFDTATGNEHFAGLRFSRKSKCRKHSLKFLKRIMIVKTKLFHKVS